MVQPELKKAMESQEENMVKMQKELDYYKKKSSAMVGVIDNLNMTVNDLAQKLENVEMSQAKTSVTISGLRLPRRKKHENVLQVLGFIYEQLGLEVNVDDAYPIGGENTSTWVVVFQTMNDKRLVMQNKSILNGTNFFINEYYPASINEKKRREKDIIRDNKQMIKPLNVEFVKGALQIQGETYKKKVLPPTPNGVD